MVQVLKLKQLKAAYSVFSCEDWQSLIRDLIIKDCLLSDEDFVEIPEKYLEKLVTEGSHSMIKYVKNLGILIPLVDRNAFVRNCSPGTGGDLRNLSMKLFNDPSTIEIAYSTATYINRQDLFNRAFYIKSKYKVILHEDLKEIGGAIIEGAIIEIVKK